MKKKIFVIISILVFVCALACVVTACKKDTSQGVVVAGITIDTYPQQYYVVGEEFNVDGGQIGIILYDTDKKTYGVSKMSMDDPSVSIENVAGTNFADKMYTVTLKYSGFTTSYRYYVQNDNKYAIKSVEVSDERCTDKLTYCVSDNRPYIKYEDFNGLKFTVKYRDTTKADLVYDLSDYQMYTNVDIKVDGWDVTTVGERELTFSYKATDYFVGYTVTDKDYISSHKYVRKNTDGVYEDVSFSEIKLNYVVGEEFDSNGVEVVYLYDSGAESSPEKLEVDVNVFDFDSSTPTGDDFRSFIIYLDKYLDGQHYECTLTLFYDVYELDDITNVMVKSTTTPNLPVKTTENEEGYMTYEEYLDTISLELLTDDEDSVPVLASDEKIIMYYLESGKTNLKDKKLFSQFAFDEIVTKGQTINLYAFYQKNSSVYCEVGALAILKGELKIVINNWNTVKTSYTAGEAFDFGDATYQLFYNDGTYEELITLKDLYGNLANNTIIREYPSCLNITSAFDMTEGHDNKSTIRYYINISTSGDVYIDGEKSDIDIGKLYIVYTIQ